MVNNHSLKGCPPKRSHVKVRNNQSECIVEILTEYVMKKGTDEDKRRKSTNVSTSRQRIGKNVHPAEPGVGQGIKRGGGFPFLSLWQLLSRGIRSNE